MKEKKLRIVPLGGLGEVGRNMMVYEYDGELLIVDTGLMFPDGDMLGVDYIIPDMTYLQDKRDKVRGIIITHGHEDHTGAIRHVLEEINAPIYATPLTRGLLEVKLAKSGGLDKAKLVTIQAGDTVEIGPFKVEFFHVCHSIPDGVGLGITTPVGLVIHQSDYKFDHTPVDNWPSDYAKLAEFSKRGVLALLADSTNAERPGWTPSERVIDDGFDKVFKEAPGRIIIASFASLISRMQQVANAAVQHGRKLAFVGTSMQDNLKIAVKLGYLELPENLQISIEQALTMPAKDVVIMCTGSQGEPTSIMGRLSTGTNRLFDVIPGDTIVLSSHPIPGNEEKVYRTINRLFQLGANVIYEAIAPVHVSGHASQEEMKLLIHLTQPKFVIPIHGEIRHLYQHGLLAAQVGIPRENIVVLENGQSIEMDSESIRMGDKMPTSNVFVEGSSVGEVDADVMREREILSRDGIVMVSLVLDRFSGGLRREPQISSRGFMLSRDTDAVMEEARRKVAAMISATNNGRLEKDIEKELGNYLYSETRRRPMIYVTISRE